MIAYREPDGLHKLTRVLDSLHYEVRLDEFRRRVLVFQLTFFGLLFIGIVGGETLFATMMFAVIQVEILGTKISGAAFALLVPTVIGAAHVALHHEGDHFTKWWLKRLSNVGILIFALGISLSVGLSAWQAAEDAVSGISSGPTGTLGGQQITSAAEPSGIADWVSVVPNTMLFLGLSFAMIIAIKLASFCLGRALQAFNVLTLTPRFGNEVKTRIAEVRSNIADLRKLRDEHETARRKLPFDVKAKFAREAAYACWKVSQRKLAAARRKFDPHHPNDPLATAFPDADVESISKDFESEQAFKRHMAEQIDAVRLHNLLTLLTGIPDEGEKP